MPIDDENLRNSAIRRMTRQVQGHLRATLRTQAKSSPEVTRDFAMSQLEELRPEREKTRRKEDARIKKERTLAGLPLEAPKTRRGRVAFEGYVAALRAQTVEGAEANVVEQADLAEYRIIGETLVVQGAPGFDAEVQKAASRVKTNYGRTMADGHESSWGTFCKLLGAAYVQKHVKTEYTTTFEDGVGKNLAQTAKEINAWADYPDHSPSWQLRSAEVNDLLWDDLQRNARHHDQDLSDSAIPVTGPIATI